MTHMRAPRIGWPGVSIVVICCAATWGVPTSGPATAPATQPADAQAIARLIRGLSSENFQARQAAEDRLVLLGDSAVAALQQAASARADAETAHRARRALRRIDESRSIGPTLVTLHFKNAPARQVFEELARQGQFPLSTNPEDLFDQRGIPQVTIDIDRQPLLEAIRELAKVSGISPQPKSWWGVCSRTLQFSRNEQGLFAGPCQVRGLPVAVMVAPIIQHVPAAIEAAPGRRLEIQVEVVFEPKLRRAGVESAAIHVDEVSTDRGESLLLDGWSDPLVRLRDCCGRLPVFLKWPEMPAQRIARVAGQIEYEVPIRTQPLEIEDLAAKKSVAKTILGGNYQVISVSQIDQDWHVRFQVDQADMADADWANVVRRSTLDPKPILFDADGNELLLTRAEQRVTGARLVGGCTYSGRIGANPGQFRKPAKLIWAVSLESQAVTVPFEFKDIPLP